MARRRLGDAPVGFWLFGEFYFDLKTFAQIVSGIDHHFCIFLQTIEHFDSITEVATDPDILPVNVMLVFNRRHLRSSRSKLKRVCGPYARCNRLAARGPTV